jgi:hypothetical protein
MGNPFTDLKDWWVRNSELHTSTILLFIIFTYFAQGARDFVDTTFDYVAQYSSMNATAADSGAALGFGIQPWAFKWAMGLVSDNLPIFGFNLKPYMFVGSLIGVGGLSMLGMEAISPTFNIFSWGYFVVQLYGALIDCLADALVIKNGRNDEEESSSGLQSLSWFSLGLGGALFTLLGSQMSTGSNPETDPVNVAGARIFMLINLLWPVGLFIFLFFLPEKRCAFSPGLKPLLQQIIRLFVSLFSPPFLVLRVALWIVISGIANIRIGTAMNPFKIEVLGITPDVSGYVDIVTYLFLSLGVIVYYKWFRSTTFRKIFLLSQFVFAFFYLAEYVLVKRWNVGWFPDVPFLMFSAALQNVADRLNAMPFLVLAGQLCPENMEATFFALMMSLSNQGSAQARVLGAFFLRTYNVTKEDFTNFETVILIRSGLMVGICIFIFLLPNTSAVDSTNIETLKPTNPFIIKILKFADMYHPEAKEIEEGKEVKENVPKKE